MPEFFEYKSHPNNRKFIPYEGYFAYWKGYVLVEALDGYDNIDKFLSREVGIQTFCNRISQITNDWNSKYKKIFERLSFYRTAQAMLNSPHSKADLTYGKIASFLIGKTKSKPRDLEQDLEMLLILFKNWQRKIEDNGKGIYVKPLEILRQDIYFLFEWICYLTDNGEKYYFDKWSYENRCANQWAQLKDVISYEEFELQDEFKKSVPFYAKEIINYGYLKDVSLAYEKLSIHDSFWPWIRSFADMHKSINRKSVVSFRQPRILDYLIIMTIRTEILIRSIYVHHIKLEEPNDLRDIFVNMSKLTNDQQVRRIFGIVVNKWTLTRLSEKPENIFQQIEDIAVKGLNNKNHHIIKQLLKFVASRNYFAHHSYKDDSINSSVSKTSADVLTSAISSLIYFKAIAAKGITTS